MEAAMGKQKMAAKYGNYVTATCLCDNETDQAFFSSHCYGYPRWFGMYRAARRFLVCSARAGLVVTKYSHFDLCD